MGLSWLPAVCYRSRWPRRRPKKSGASLSCIVWVFRRPPLFAWIEEIRAALDKSPYQIELYEETIQGILFSDPASQREVRHGHIRKYRDRRPDIVIAVAPAPIKFMAESHEEFGPNTPVVICASSKDQLENLKLDSRFTGAWRTLDAAKTLEAALQLRPGTKHVVVVGRRCIFV